MVFPPFGYFGNIKIVTQGRNSLVIAVKSHRLAV